MKGNFHTICLWLDKVYGILLGKQIVGNTHNYMLDNICSAGI